MIGKDFVVEIAGITTDQLLGIWPEDDWMGNSDLDLNFFQDDEECFIALYPVIEGETQGNDLICNIGIKVAE